MVKKAATASEKAYMDKVQKLGCLVCGADANRHHPRTGVGTAQRASHWLVVPLCKYHHQDSAGSIHQSCNDFLLKYKSGERDVVEMRMLAEVIERLNSDDYL